MLKSMTGFGKSVLQFPDKKITAEIKSLNSKNINISIKLPEPLRELELGIKNLISGKLVRGKIELVLTLETIGTATGTRINNEIINSYINEYKKIYSSLDTLPNTDIMLSTIMRFPDVFKPSETVIDNEDKKIVLQAVENAINELDIFRKKEGEILLKDILQKVNKIEELQTEIGKYKDERIEKIKDRIKSKIDASVPPEIRDDNRFEQEIIYYLEKLDINEEEIRLANHCKYFIETVKEESAGKKLGFISQEMGREINTLGSKASHGEIQKNVIMMKDELEKIKEQLLNIL